MFLTACGEQSTQSRGQGDGVINWLSQGDGVENDEALWTLQPGFRQFRAKNWSGFNNTALRQYDTLVGEPVEFHGLTVYPFGHAAWEGITE